MSYPIKALVAAEPMAAQCSVSAAACVAAGKVQKGPDTAQRFLPMDAPAADDEPTVLELPEDGSPLIVQSLCMQCHDNGETTILLTKIPHFRELVIYAFECQHCGSRNNEVQFAGTFGELGVRYTLEVEAGQPELLSRQVVKSDSASVTVPELEFEIPAATQKGTITTLEGLLSDAADNLRALQEQRHQQQPETAAAIDAFLSKLDSCTAGQQAFTFVLDDPAGNSYLESPDGDVSADAALKVQHYERSREQAEAVGLSVPDTDVTASGSQPEIAASDPHHGHRAVGAAAAHAALAKLQGADAEAVMARYTAPEDVLELPGHCSACGASCATRMYQTSIPFFKSQTLLGQAPVASTTASKLIAAKAELLLANLQWGLLLSQEVIIMCNACDACGYKSSEVKGAGAISPKGRRITVQVQQQADLNRDVIKADSATVSVPEIDLEVTSGAMGGLITTVEGLMVAIKDALQSLHSFQLGDSAAPVQRSKWTAFLDSLEACRQLDTPWTLILSDPLANSFVAPCGDDLESDTRLTIEDYARSAEEDEDFAIDHLQRLQQEEGAAADELQRMNIID
ncbi:hypothetical protein MMC07_000442 [Pseudocyphellaria aurata]|nr:hypothetical protein [Pseudocyphellaria aurata]